MNPEKIVRDLTEFPHRSTCGPYSKKVLQYLSDLLPEVDTILQSFETPKNYLVIVTWLIVGLITGMAFTYFWPGIGVFISGVFVLMSFLFFNWYSSPATSLPPLSKAYNLIFKKESIPTNTLKKRIILMTHWDTAPISVLYKPSMVGNFRISLKINLILIASVFVWAVVHFFINSEWVNYVGLLLALYMIIQIVVANWDFFRFGYSNGASDNATGVAAAITTAQNCWNANLQNTEIELVLTGAEEVGMIGAKAYYQKYATSFNKNTYLINFDTLGAGNLKIITQTGTFGTIDYENILIDTANDIVKQNPKLSHVETGAWHTTDFDSVWFNRAGMATVTLAALDSDGRMPNIHRETDVLANVDFKPMHDAIELATEMIKKMDS